MSPLNQGDRLARRYEIQEMLGHGAMGEVYRARDAENGDAVAIKVMIDRPELRDEFMRRFEREIATLRRLAHPSIVGYRDHGRDGTHVFLVMELLHGTTLSRALERFRGQAEHVFLLGVRVARALAAAHRAGVIHRDLKPSNILIGDDGEPKVLDYGLARWDAGEGDLTAELTRDQLTRSHALLGTVPYMSPEQIRIGLRRTGETIDRRSDIFSLGVLLFEAVAGRRPYVSDQGIGELLEVMEQGAPPRLDSIRHELASPAGSALDAVLRRAVEPALERRFQSMDDLADALDRGMQLHSAMPGDAAPTILLPPTLATGDQQPTEMVGRDRELALLRGALDGARDGRGAAFVIAGPSGIGRTRLAHELVRVAHRVGFLCLAATAEPDGPSPEAQWLRRAGEVFPRDAGLARLLEDVDESGAYISSGSVTDGESDLLMSALATLARRMPLLLVAEEIHDAEPETLRVLAGIALTSRSHPVQLVLTHGSDAPIPVTAENALERLLAVDGLERIELGPLTPAHVKSLAAELYPGLTLDDPTAALIVERGGGNPSYIRALLAHLEQTSSLRRDGGDWTLRPIDTLPVPELARKALARRLRRIGDEPRSLIEIGAVLGDRFRASEAAELLGLAADSVEFRLRALAERHRLLQREQDEFVFHQPLMRELIAESIDDERRAALHLRAAKMFGDAAGEVERIADARVCTRIARHYLGAYRDDDAVPYCARSGALLRESGDPERAIRWLDRARSILERRLELLSESDRGGSRVTLAEIDLALGHCLDDVGRASDAAAVFEQARGLALTAELPELHVRSLVGLAAASLGCGEVLRAQRRAREAGRAAGKLRLERERARAMAIEAHALSMSDAGEDAIETWEHAAGRFESLGLVEDAAETRWRLGNHHFNLSRYDDARRCYDEAGALIADLGRTRLSARILNSKAGVVLAEGNPSEALPLFQEALAVRRSINARRGVATTLHNIAYCQQMLGDRHEARRILEEVIALRRASGEVARMTDSQRNYASVLHELGLIENALEQITETISTKKRIEELRRLPPCLTLVGEIGFSLGRSERAREAFAEVLRDFTDYRRDAMMAGLGMARVEWLGGQDDDALARLEQIVERVDSEKSIADRVAVRAQVVQLLARHETGGDRVGPTIAPLDGIDLRELLPDPALQWTIALSDAAARDGRVEDARLLLRRAFNMSRRLGRIELTWRIHRNLARLSPEGSEERRRELTTALSIVDAQAATFTRSRLREAYLAHRARVELRRMVEREPADG